MQLTVLGKYGPFPKAGGATSSYLLSVKNKNILLDFGAGAFSRLSSIISPKEVDIIFISHFHSDHSSDLGILTYYYQTLFAGGYGKKPTVIIPEKSGDESNIVVNCPYFEVKRVAEGSQLSIGGLSLSFYEMNHPVPCVGVRINDGEKTFSYTGDTNLSPSVEHLFKGADLVLCDGCFLSCDWTESKPHLSIEHIIDFTNKYGNKSIISHINPKYEENELQKVIQKAEGKCILAEEGECYRI